MLALFAAGILGAGVAVAQHPGAQGGPQQEGMHGFGRLHKQLNLNPQQEDLWQKAQAAQRDAFKSLRAKGAEHRDQLRDQMRAEMDASRKQVRSAWFSVYDSLDPQQREQVRVAIRDGMDRTGHRGMRRGPHGGAQGESLGRAPFGYSAGEG
jgi:hypothetical protein